MASTMPDIPLTITALLRHGARIYGDAECVTWTGNGTRRTTYAEIAQNAERLAAALAELGIRPGDRVATFMWNNQEHLEAYFAIPCMGAVLHTLNIRLFPEQLSYIADHAGDKVILVDDSLIPLLARCVDELHSVEALIVVGDADASALGDRIPVLRYADLLAEQEPGYIWPEVDERAAAAMCYTSGTTGDPKGVVYSHRSTFLHALASSSANLVGVTESDRVIVIVPMFHVNGWGLPYVAFLTGAALHMPGPFLQPGHLTAFMEAEQTTIAAGVPTIWSAILDHGVRHEIDLSSLRKAFSGGAAVSPTLLEHFELRHGLHIVQGWGMTETTALGGLALPPARPADNPRWRHRSGRVAAGVEMRIIDTTGEELPWDGTSTGEIEVRGLWITGAYHHHSAPDTFHDGWLRTGDIGTIDHHGYFQITDRAKDIIKSGGEWISSVELENLLAAHPAVLETAVIGIPDPRWDERPLACVVLREGETASARQLAAFLEGKVAKWQIPEHWTFLSDLPKTAVGKIDKKLLRSRFHAEDPPS
ncbi:long-chain fatty acid--CoA ligase [Streptomyces sp. SID12501]|uniref:Long-chain fatty acid--CoA ligase n=1 Tax=Streptomyces sp. SID12501 TaxID=2706042 RepID=A0A6B3BUL2_9ACTN|nr:long-chain fatty acid--CoA ligase [Streptomyces sp. SID12501]